jgi:hypothetical protein
MLSQQARALTPVPGYPDRYLSLFAQRGEPAIVLNGTIYKPYSNMVVPFGPADVDYSLSRKDAATALQQLGGMLVRTTGGFDGTGGGEWYAVICRHFTEVEDAQSPNTRSKLRRALRNCEVRRIGAEELSQSGYQVYATAQQRYGGPPMLGPKSFVTHAMATEGFEDIVHHWGAYCDGTLQGYSSNYLFGTREVTYTTTRFNPAFFKKYVSYALFHRMNQYYLADHGFDYVNNGFRSILHETQVQEFLLHTFRFEKSGTPLDVTYRAPYGALMRATFPLRTVIGKLNPRFRALYEVERVVRLQA